MNISEAIPSENHKATKYYHGTGSKEAAMSIWKKGLDPQFTEIKYGKDTPNFRPVAGRVYLTNDPAYAAIYAIGGSYIGTAVPESKKDNVGYVFVFDGDQLSDIQPDEDSVGEFISHYLNKDSPYMQDHYGKIISSHVVAELARRAPHYMAASSLRRVKDGELSYQAKLGKIMLKNMTDYEKLALIDLGAHVSHGGILKASEMWMVPVKWSAKINKDGSNLFDIAKRVK